MTESSLESAKRSTLETGKRRRRGGTRKKTGDDPATVADRTRSHPEAEEQDPATSTAPLSTWDLFQMYSPNHASEEAQIRLASMSRTSSQPTGAAVPLSSEMVHLLKAYQTGVATWMDMFDYSCTYQREVLRRCTTSELLAYSVCAFTAKNLSLLPSGEIWAHSAGQYYSIALQMMIRYLGEGAAHQEDALTATMLLSSYEMIASQEEEHKQHFYGAMLLIKNRGVSASSVGMDLANFWIYIRHEIFVALVNEAPLQISPGKWNVRWREGETNEDMLGNQILWLVGRAINVLYWSGPATDTRQDILADASRWYAGLPASFHGIKYSECDDQGFCRIYFALPASDTRDVPQIEYHASEIANIGLSDICQCVRNFSVQATFFAHGSIHPTRFHLTTRIFQILALLTIVLRSGRHAGNDQWPQQWPGIRKFDL
ncbi:hypothetical protein PWT90_04806 [Aphanocladium album]|nr:hypothetical protein PWT90_04806 [Aphanocladium album]